jgi:RNA polymerase sigma-32 factor
MPEGAASWGELGDRKMSSLKLPAVPVDSGLTRYFREVWTFPILKPEEEFMLATRWRDHGDVEAAHKLVTSHLRLVAKIAMKYRGYGLPVADLVSEGNIGLMKAVKKFEPERGFRLSTYAMWWIRAAITEYVLRSWSMVKMGTVAAQKKLFFSLRRLKGRLTMVEGGDLEPEHVTILSNKMGVSERDIVDMNRRLSSRDVSLNTPLSDNDGAEFQDTLVDESPSPEAYTLHRQESTYRHDLLVDAMAGLPERERHILTERRLSDDPQTLEQLGVHYGISRERVRQLEVRAFDKVKKAMEAAAAAGPA